MRKIGLIGGMSWVSTANYYTRINSIVQKRLGGFASPHMLIESVPGCSRMMTGMPRRG